MAIDKSQLVQVREYGDIYVHRTTRKVYRIGAKGQLLEINFHPDALGAATWFQQGVGYVRRARALALALLPRPEGAVRIRHKNKNPFDDRLSNIEWVTPDSKSVESYRAKYISKNIYMAFSDGHGGTKQYWVDREAVKDLMGLKPKARGQFKPEYRPKSSRTKQK